MDDCEGHASSALQSLLEYRACAPCTQKPENSIFVPPSSFASDVHCAWKCLPGFYSELGSYECKPCSVLTADQCKPGFVYTACSDFWHEDASCDTPCDAEALGKPPGDETSEWVWTTYGGEDGVTLVEQTQLPQPSYMPASETAGLNYSALGYQCNIGCMWKCKKGFVLRSLELLEPGKTLAFCVPE